MMWKVRKGPLRAWRIAQRAIGVREIDCRYYGARFHVDLRDLIGFDVATGRFEWTDIGRLLAACSRLRPSTFIDVGANIGVFSCIVGLRGLDVVAIEPQERNFAVLKRHLIANGLQARARAIRVAAGAERRDSIGLVRVDPANSGTTAVSETDASDGSAPMIRLDELDLPRGECIALKVDVEGYEPFALRGAADLLSSNGGYAMIEAPGTRAQSVAELMSAAGWQPADSWGINMMFEKSAIR